MLLNKNSDNILIKLYINGKEIKDENIPLGIIVEGEKAEMLIACLTLTDEIINDEKKINENLIKNLAKSCLLHNGNRMLNLCLNCTTSICDICISDHPNHKVICKKEIINYEENLREIATFMDEKFNEIGIKQTHKENPANYQEFYKNLRIELNKQCESLLNLVEEIKKKEIQLLNNLKLDLDPTLPAILDYRDKINDLIYQITENKKEKILRNDSEFIEFYLKYLQVNNISEKTKQNLLYIRNIADKYKETTSDFKMRLDLLSKAINENMDKIRSYDIGSGNSSSLTSLNLNLNPLLPKVEKGITNNYPLNNSYNFGNIHTNNKNENINFFNSINKNDNLNYFNSNNKPEIGRSSTPVNFNGNLITYSNYYESNIKQQNENFNPNNSFQNSNNYLVSSKINLINLLGSSGKNKNNLIKSLNKFGSSKSPPHLDQSIKNNLSNTKDFNLNSNNILTQLNKSNNKSIQNIPNEEESSINILNEVKEDNLILQNKIYATQISSKFIFIYDKITNTIIKQEIDLSDTPLGKFESNQSTLNYNNKFYISGGSGFYSAKLFFELDQQSFKLKKLNDLLFKHPYHSLLGANNCVYALAGFNAKKCEKFDLKTYTWNEMPDLTEARSFPNCIFLENKFIYVFGGLIDSLMKSNLIVERINLFIADNWEKLECNCSTDKIQNIPFYSGLIKTSSNKILLLGGKIDKESVATNNISNLDLKENALMDYPEAKLINPEEFQGRMFLKFDSNKYAQFSTLNQTKLYIFDENNDSFEVLEFK